MWTDEQTQMLITHSFITLWTRHATIICSIFPKLSYHYEMINVCETYNQWKKIKSHTGHHTWLTEDKINYLLSFGTKLGFCYNDSTSNTYLHNKTRLFPTNCIILSSLLLHVSAIKRSHLQGATLCENTCSVCNFSVKDHKLYVKCCSSQV